MAYYPDLHDGQNLLIRPWLWQFVWCRLLRGCRVPLIDKPLCGFHSAPSFWGHPPHWGRACNLKNNIEITFSRNSVTSMFFGLWIILKPQHSSSIETHDMSSDLFYLGWEWWQTCFFWSVPRLPRFCCLFRSSLCKPSPSWPAGWPSHAESRSSGLALNRCPQTSPGQTLPLLRTGR